MRQIIGYHVVLLLSSSLLECPTAESAPADTTPSPLVHRVYSHLLEPREHPDYERRAVRPPDWATFGHRTQFTALRGFAVENDRITGYAEELEKFTRTFELGDVVWPSYPILFATNLVDLAEEVKRRSLFLFDVWGYVPGSGPGGYWQQFRPPLEAFANLDRILGERWLGTDIGEQDGRYIGGYGNQMTPASGGHFEQYLNFQRHFERMGDELGHRHATLVSLNFGHYFLKEGTYTLIGAETAQALPNSQVYYAFIRGAGKQYGVPWFGNASIFNRWGYKVYGSSGRSDGYDFGPTQGTSLSLMKRLLYSHILYNSVAVGFENGWFEGAGLSPIGRIQQSANRWVQRHGSPGVQHTPVALLLDFYCGWSFPRHLYTDKIHRVWGNLPYGEGDHLTDGILDLLYPGYADASYFRDETGFLTPTPYGDIADCLLSDAPSWVLDRYAVVILAGALTSGRELEDKLAGYVRAGGHLVLTEGNRALLPPEIALPPVGQTSALGQGRVSVVGPAFGVARQTDAAPVKSEVDGRLVSPWPLRSEVRAGLDRILQGQRLFEVDPRLQLVTCRKGRGAYTLGIFNNRWEEIPFRIESLVGRIEQIEELTLDTAERIATGFLPAGLAPTNLGTNTASTIAGGEVRIFAVRVQETGTEEIPHVRPGPRPTGRWLPLRAPRGLKEEILARPTFFEHFDGVLVDWRYLHEREVAALAREAGWLRRQGMRVAVDLSSGVNLYPTLRLIDNLTADYQASVSAVTNVLAKMAVFGACDLVFSLHRHPENNFTGEQTQAAFVETLKMLAAVAGRGGITLHLRMAFGKPPWNLAEAAALLDEVGAPNLRLAPSTALLLAAGTKAEAVAGILKEKAGLWLVAAPRRDAAGQLWDAHAPMQGSGASAAVREWIRLLPNLPVALDAVLGGSDAEYLEVMELAEPKPAR